MPAAARDTAAILSILVRSMVDSPDAVDVETVLEPKGACFRLRVAKTDVGKVIGKQGRTSRSLRVILLAIGQTHDRQFSLDIVEDK